MKDNVAYLTQSGLPPEYIQKIMFDVVAEFRRFHTADGIEIPRTAEWMIEFLSISAGQFYKLVREGVIKQHRFYDGGTPYYFPSQVIARLKGTFT